MLIRGVSGVIYSLGYDGKQVNGAGKQLNDFGTPEAPKAEEGSGKQVNNTNSGISWPRVA